MRSDADRGVPKGHPDDWLRARRDHADGAGWCDVCALDEVLPGTGAAALIAGVQVALVRMPDGETVYAVGNFDPFSKANVIARGIVGDWQGAPKIASPIYKQSFDLRTGACLDDSGVTLPIWPARVREGRIEIRCGVRREPR